MKRHIPFEKLSKKEQQKLAKARRGDWGGLNPVTRKPPKPGAYKRKKARYDEDGVIAGHFIIPYMSLRNPARGHPAFSITA